MFSCDSYRAGLKCHEHNVALSDVLHWVRFGGGGGGRGGPAGETSRRQINTSIQIKIVKDEKKGEAKSQPVHGVQIIHAGLIILCRQCRITLTKMANWQYGVPSNFTEHTICIKTYTEEKIKYVYLQAQN